MYREYSISAAPPHFKGFSCLMLYAIICSRAVAQTSDMVQIRLPVIARLTQVKKYTLMT